MGKKEKKEPITSLVGVVFHKADGFSVQLHPLVSVPLSLLGVQPEFISCVLR